MLLRHFQCAAARLDSLSRDQNQYILRILRMSKKYPLKVALLGIKSLLVFMGDTEHAPPFHKVNPTPNTFVCSLRRQFDAPPPVQEPDSIAQLLEESDLDFDTKRWLQREYTRCALRASLSRSTVRQQTATKMF